MRVGLAAIVRNEVSYLLEWIAWHQNLGFNQFWISDNQSDDGTLELLEDLQTAGVVRLHRQPREKMAQITAYNFMLSRWRQDLDRVAFLDADEFLVSNDGRNPLDHLEDLIAPKQVGAIAVAWRLFGSSGHEHRTEGLVIERFTRCAPDEHAKCRFFKSYCKPALIAEQRVHHAILAKKAGYLDTAGKPVEFVNLDGKPLKHGGGLKREPGPGTVRVHHYIVKSLEEYTRFKQKRGDAHTDPHHDRGIAYFRNHDSNELECLAALPYLEQTRQGIARLRSLLPPRSRDA